MGKTKKKKGEIEQKTLSETFSNAMKPLSQEHFYKESIRQSLWSVDHFAALIAGLTPKNYKNGTKGLTAISDKTFAKREAYATKVFSQFLDFMNKNTAYARRYFTYSNTQMLMSPWKFIKWIAENDVPMHKRFFSSLPLYLMGLYFEFQPINTALRTASHQSRAYQEAYYLKHAEDLVIEYPLMTPSEVYRHDRMKNVELYIRELGGNYKKRTFLESWLPKIFESKRGRPQKH